MFYINFSKDIRKAAPGLRVLAVEADITNDETPDSLWCEIEETGRAIRECTPIDQVNKLPGIAPTRLAYKACGKEPNRYRPSAEALTRRMVKGMSLYRTLKAIDVINLISLQTGHSIGGFDADNIEGDSLTLDIGYEGEPFAAIGRGDLNIAGLPVYRDAMAAIGTPTSDCERTKLTPNTTHLLMLVNVYDTSSDMDRLKSLISDALSRHGMAVKSMVEWRIPWRFKGTNPLKDIYFEQNN